MSSVDDPIAEALGPELEVPLFERTSDLLAEPHPGPAPFVVADLLARGGICCLVGTSKVGKTWAVLDLSMSIAAGVPALSRFKVEQGPVLLILEESGRAAYYRRIDKLSRGRAIDREDLTDLYFATNRGFNLSREEWRSSLLAEACAVRPNLIVLDPLARIKGGSVDESSQLEIGPVLDFMRELRERSGSAVLFVHHTGHNEKSRMRGSSDLEAYWESKITITQSGDGTRLQADHREAEAAGPFGYSLRFDGETDTARLEVEGKEVSGIETMVLDYLRDHPGSTRDEIQKGVHKRRADSRSAIENLIEAGNAYERRSDRPEHRGTPNPPDLIYPALGQGPPPFPGSRNGSERQSDDPQPFPRSRPLEGGNGNAGGLGTLEDALRDPVEMEQIRAGVDGEWLEGGNGV